MQVLLVDDNPLMQQVISRFLMSQGYQVTVARDGAEAIDLAQRGAFRVLVIDMRLPDIDGPQLLGGLRQLPALSGCMAIAVSGLGEDDREQTVRAGFDRFMAKPIDLDELLAVVRHHLDSPLARAVGM